MSSKWGRYKSQGGGGSGGLFVKVESDAPGIEFMVPSGSVPHERYVSWDEAKGTYVDQAGPGRGISCKVLIAVVRANGEPGILEIPAGTFADLCACLDHPKVGGSDQIYEVSKTGAGIATRWKVVRLDRATPEQIARAGRAALPEITTGTPMRTADEPKSVATADIAEQPAADADIPF